MIDIIVKLEKLRCWAALNFTLYNYVYNVPSKKNGFMATPELGHRMYGYTLLDCIVESQECSNCMYSEPFYFIYIFDIF